MTSPMRSLSIFSMRLALGDTVVGLRATLLPNIVSNLSSQHRDLNGCTNLHLAASLLPSRFSAVLRKRQTITTISYAAVHHGEEYRAALAGRHGQQLQLAWKEGYNKNATKFDPFEKYKIHPSNDAEADSLTDQGNILGERKIGGAEAVSLFVQKDVGDPNKNCYISLTQPTTAVAATKQYNSNGSVLRSPSLIASLRAGLPAGGIFAIVDLNGSQQKVTVDDLVIVNKLKPVSEWAVGTVHTLADDNVLLVGSSDLTLVGLPGVTGAEVDVMVEELTRDATVLVFKKRRRKHSRRKNGFRREVTFLRVLDIRFPKRFESIQYEKEKM